MSQYLPAIEIETAPDPRFSVIWMHGLGADGSDFVPIIPELELPPSPGVRFIFPNAPMQPVTCNGGFIMPAWYDIEFLGGGDRRVDEAGIARSAAAIRLLMDREKERGIPAGHIIVAGFSQGGAMAYTVGLGHPEPLAGIVALSAYLPAPAVVEGEKANRHTPIFAAHGSEDDVVPLVLGEVARDTLRKLEARLDWHVYPMDHSVCLEEIADLGRWLRERLQGTA